MKVTILNYTGNEVNWGCQVTSRNLVQLLEHSFGEKIQLEFINIGQDHGILGKILNKLRFWITYLISPDNEIIHNLLMYSSRFIEGSSIEKIISCNYLILNGEGSIHGNNTELIKFIHYLRFAKAKGKHTAIINHSLQFDNEGAKNNLYFLYKYSNVNFFRDAISIENYKLISQNSNYRFVPDALFLNADLRLEDMDAIPNLPEKYILVSGSVTLRENDKNYFSFINRLNTEFGLPILFLTHSEEEIRLIQFLQSNYNWHIITHHEITLDQVHKLIDNAFFFVSGRYHLNIAAAISGKIFVPFSSNTIKMQGLLNLLSHHTSEIDIKNFDENEVITQISQLIDNRKLIEWNLKKKTQELSMMIKKSYEFLPQLMYNNS